MRSVSSPARRVATVSEAGPAGMDSPGRRPPRRRAPSRHVHTVGFLFTLPAILFLAIFVLVPVGYGFYLSFTSYNPVLRGGPQLIGIENYKSILTDSAFGESLGTTGLYMLLVLPLAVVLSLGLALLVNRASFGVGLFRTALYIPHIVSLTVVSMIWLWLYSRQGWFNQLLDTFFDAGPKNFLLDSNSALLSVAAMRVWKTLGGDMVLILAGLQAAPRELYDAAAVDGAGRWQQFRYITLPALMPMLTYVVVTNVIYLAQSFTEMFLLTEGGPVGETTTVNYLIYTEAFQYNHMGRASAMAFILFALVSAVSYVTLRRMAGRSRR